MNIFKYNSVDRKIFEAVALMSESIKQAGYAKRVQDIYGNIENHESNLALENLCENLYEISCMIPQRVFELLNEAGTAMNITSEYWERLKPQVLK